MERAAIGRDTAIPWKDKKREIGVQVKSHAGRRHLVSLLRKRESYNEGGGT